MSGMANVYLDFELKTNYGTISIYISSVHTKKFVFTLPRSYYA